MKKFFTLFCSIVFFGSILLPSSVAMASTATTPGAVTLSEFADIENPQPNEPEGPQGNPTPNNQLPNTGTSSTGKLPQTGELVAMGIPLFGAILILVILLYLVFERKKYSSEETPI